MADAPEVQTGGGAATSDETQQSSQLSFDPKAPEVQALVQQAIDAATKTFKKEKDEFRENNIRLMKEVDAYKSSGLAPDQIRKIAENMAKNEEVRLAAEGKFDELVALRIDPMKRDYEAKLAAQSDAFEELSERHRKAEAEIFDLVVGSRVSDAVAKHPDVHPSATPVITEFARKVWRKDESGEIRPYRQNGAPWISKDAKNHISFEEWIDELREPYPFLFKVPQGVNARGGPAKSNIDHINSIPRPADRIEEMRRLGLKL